jgi:hypothetical protein
VLTRVESDFLFHHLLHDNFLGFVQGSENIFRCLLGCRSFVLWRVLYRFGFFRPRVTAL